MVKKHSQAAKDAPSDAASAKKIMKNKIYSFVKDAIKKSKVVEDETDKKFEEIRQGERSKRGKFSL
jgi:hypothetical protein